jgi:predicted enzyme related to lactoylglutathione lyase
MVMNPPPKVGTIGWIDLTVPDASKVRDFYCKVVGWTTSEVDMGGYADYCVHPPDGDPVAGICHARGTNAEMPPAWLIYITVADLNASLAKCRTLGGEVVTAVRDMGGYGRIAVVRDPAGAVCALIQPPDSTSR